VSERADAVRARAIAVIRRRQEVLLSFAIDPDSGARYGRFLGGGIEPGEPPEETVRRELLEEIGIAIGRVTRLGVLDNSFMFNGRTHRETVVVCAAEFADTAAYDRSAFPVNEAVCDGPAEWVPIDRILRGAIVVYPPELTILLDRFVAHNLGSGPVV
jgi:8-oxo-dGTP pyrophosphatase MutT (NUDIX family)